MRVARGRLPKQKNHYKKYGMPRRLENIRKNQEKLMCGLVSVAMLIDTDYAGMRLKF